MKLVRLDVADHVRTVIAPISDKNCCIFDKKQAKMRLRSEKHRRFSRLIYRKTAATVFEDECFSFKSQIFCKRKQVQPYKTAGKM